MLPGTKPKPGCAAAFAFLCSSVRASRDDGPHPSGHDPRGGNDTKPKPGCAAAFAFLCSSVRASPSDCIKKAHEDYLMGFGFVELVGFEPTSGEGTACAFYMFSSACCREQIGAVRTKSAPYPAC
jgi:hypothetical protein